MSEQPPRGKPGPDNGLSQSLPQLDTGLLSIEDRADALKGSAYVEGPDGKPVPTQIQGFGGSVESEDGELDDVLIKHTVDGEEMITPSKYFSFSQEPEEQRELIEKAGWTVDVAGHLVPPSAQNPEDRRAIEEYQKRIIAQPEAWQPDAFSKNRAEMEPENAARQRGWGKAATGALFGALVEVADDRDKSSREELDLSEAKTTEFGVEEPALEEGHGLEPDLSQADTQRLPAVESEAEVNPNESREPKDKNDTTHTTEAKDAPTILGSLSNFNRQQFDEEYYAEHKRHFKPIEPNQVYYRSDEAGHAQSALEFRKGSIVALGEIAEKMSHERKELSAIINASGKGGFYTGYIRNGKIYEIVRKGEESSVTVGEISELPTMMVGQDFGEFTLDDVTIDVGSFELQEGKIAEAIRLSQEISGSKGKDKKELLEQIQFLEQVGKPRGENPFVDADLAISKIESGITDPKMIIDNRGSIIGGLEWQRQEDLIEQQLQRAKAARERDQYNPEEVRLRINELANLFSNKAYVPKPRELKEMQELARHIIVDDFNGLTPVYKLTDGTKLPLSATDTFIRNARNERWLLSDKQEEIFSTAKTEESWTSLHKRKLFTKRSKTSESSILLVDEFRKAMEDAGEIETAEGKSEGRMKAIDRKLGSLYKIYISDRVRLSQAIKKRGSRDQYLKKDTFTDSRAINIYTAFHRKRIIDEQEEQRRQQSKGRDSFRNKIWQELDKVHRKNMKIDGAVQRKMNDTVAMASDASRRLERGLNSVNRRSMRLDSTVRRGMDATVRKASKAKAKTRRKVNSLRRR